jgi:hypothetical protein
MKYVLHEGFETRMISFEITAKRKKNVN